ncbi:hypothetical protein K0B96_01240 [Horticoccus luteus]|uniref:Uncharacterized protein n=1 Tax=Horticoccus luteus TaxID=2862869 RepID=A0A8F9XLI8_9BACT|nr:hypothetical protein [Horticoccus luteus]QYM79271.1 hypothetical protein K0B96_01240 [Horticoccus luteus]
MQKRVINLDDNTEVSLLRYLYAGWELVAETKGDGTIVRSYLWGLDIADSLSATGGVGALLQVTNHGASQRTRYLAAYADGGWPPK